MSGFVEKMLLNYLDIKTLIKLLENMLIMKTKKAAPSKRRVRLDGILFLMNPVSTHLFYPLN